MNTIPINIIMKGEYVSSVDEGSFSSTVVELCVVWSLSKFVSLDCAGRNKKYQW